MSAPNTPATLPPMRADRYVPLRRTIRVEGLDLTAATASMQVRLNWNAGGSPLVSISTVASASGSLAFALDGLDTVITIDIAESVMEGLPYAAERSDDARFVWDMHITHAGRKAVWFRGDFVVVSGSTQDV